MKLLIGDKNLSSWSLRPWLVLKHFGIPFDEMKIWLDRPEFKSQVLQYSPTGKVPCLADGDLTIPDSLAICEYLNEKYPEKKMWPQDSVARAKARAISCEMHSGFQNLRTHMSHNIKARFPGFDSSKAASDIERIQQIFRECRATARDQGPYLFGEFSIADAMFAPVVNRFRTYDVQVYPPTREYMDTMFKHPGMHEWERDALEEVRPT
jgi:glutathione S-transferase